MTQANLFDRPRSALEDLFFDLDQDDGLRWNQRESVDAIHAEHLKVRSTIIVQATGTGKSVVAARYIKEWRGGPVMALAHRDELIQQLKEHLERTLGEFVDIEQGNQQSSFRSRYVVGSVQSVMQKKRLERMGHDRFGLIFIDEFHHAPSPSYRKIMDWFGPAKILGATATPDRADERALGQVADSMAYVYDIERAIDDGYLVPLMGKHVDVKEVDISQVKTQSGDLADGQLDEVMVNAAAGIVTETLRLFPDKQCVCFWPGVKSSELAAQLFNEKSPGSACHIDGGTDRDLRRELMRDYKAGRIRYFNNVGIATEGWDAPNTAVVVMGRPTKSRALYAQMVGRVTRVVAGSVEHLKGPELADARRAVIAASTKPHAVILDFVSNSGRHDLVTPEDLLGGKYTDEEVALAKKARKKGEGGDVRAELEKARTELRRLASAAKSARVTATVSAFDPFRALGISIADSKKFASGWGNPIPTGLWDALVKRGVSEQELKTMSKGAAGKLYTELKRRIQENLCTYKQSKHLMKYGVDPSKVTFSRASEALDYLFRSPSVDRDKLHDILERTRQPGDEG